jgi:ubiquinone/menaquinone biosynthesis C-methylase UbiE
VFTKSAAYYDAIYAFKDYAGEARQLHALIERHKRTDGNALLDVACGTGGHVGCLRQHYVVEGLDLDDGMLDVARRRHPDVSFHRGDMVSFDLGRQFDAVVCLFSSIGYVKTVPRLHQAIQTMGRHLRRGGVLVVEPWLTPETYGPGRLHASFVDQPDLKIARMNLSSVDDGVSVLDFHYLIATPEGIEHLTERHELGLFSHDDYVAAFQSASLRVVHLPEGLTPSSGRGLYIGCFEGDVC